MEPEKLRKLMKKGAAIGSFFALALVFYGLGWRSMLVVYVVFVGVLATLAILLQAGRGGGLAASLGGFGADSLLGAHSATPIAKATYVMLGLFLFICMLAARMGARPEQGEGLIPADAPVEFHAPGAGEPLPLQPPLDEGAEPAADAPAAEGETPQPGEPLQDD